MAAPTAADLQIRPARPADAPAVRALVNEVLAEFALAPDPGRTDADLADLPAAYAGGCFDVLVEPGGGIIGCVGVYRIDAGTCELRKMYLRGEWRGRGLGRRLLEHGLACARRLGFRTVVLETATVLTRAVAMYERHGFRRYYPDHMSSRCNQAWRLQLDEHG